VSAPLRTRAEQILDELAQAEAIERQVSGAECEGCDKCPPPSAEILEPPSPSEATPKPRRGMTLGH
jgi:hypothetical protein